MRPLLLLLLALLLAPPRRCSARPATAASCLRAPSSDSPFAPAEPWLRCSYELHPSRPARHPPTRALPRATMRTRPPAIARHQLTTATPAAAATLPVPPPAPASASSRARGSPGSPPSRTPRNQSALAVEPRVHSHARPGTCQSEHELARRGFRTERGRDWRGGRRPTCGRRRGVGIRRPAAALALPVASRRCRSLRPAPRTPRLADRRHGSGPCGRRGACGNCHSG